MKGKRWMQIGIVRYSTPIIMIWTNKNSPTMGGGEASNEGLELTKGEKQIKKDNEEDEEIDQNIQTVAAEGDLSPRQLSNSKSGAKKNHLVVPLQVRTRSNKDSSKGLSQ